MNIALFIATAVLSTALPAMATSAAGASLPPCSKTVTTNCVAAESSGSGFGAGGATGGNSEPSGTGARPVGAKPAPTVIEQKRYVPACTGNTATDGGLLCTYAAETCPDQGEVRFWVYTREYNTVTNRALTDWERAATPSTVCLGPDDPVIDPAIAIPAIVQRDFKRVVVVKGVAEVSPRPDTLVNIPTVFSTRTPPSYDIPLNLLGQSVVITATAERYTWHFGDGTSASASAPGGRVEHEYREAVSRQAYVVIEWSGTFRINGGAAQTINGRATTTGDPVAVDVKQARTELVRG